MRNRALNTKKRRNEGLKGELNTEKRRNGEMRNELRAALIGFLFFLCFSVFTNPIRANEPVKITVTAPLAWLRNEPSLLAGNTLPVAKGQFYELTGRTADNAWWRLNVPNMPASRGTWLLADLGVLYSGDLNVAPVVAASAPAPKAPSRTAPKSSKKVKALERPAWIPTITPEQRAIYQRSAQSGKDLNMFTVVGDCNSQPAVYLQRIATGEFDASRLDPQLQAIVVRFSRSFPRVSLAARGGFGTGSMMDPAWADPALCDKTVGPFACEMWVSRASIVFIELGTGDQFDWKNFEANYRPLIEHALHKGVLPVLVTKADDIEVAGGAPSSYINDVIRRLAREYNTPLLDLWQGTRALPNNGLIDEGDKDFHLSNDGMNLHLLATLHTLAAIVEL
jgi:hypothetical protein